MTSKEIVESYIPMAKFIAAVFGPRCEIILHCLDDMEHSIVYIENGCVTGRSVGGCITDFALKTINDHRNGKEDKAFIANYMGKTLKGNKTLKSSTYFIRDDKNKIIGLLCINVDVTELSKLKQILDTELSAQNQEVSDEKNNSEQFSLSVNDVVDSIFNQTMSETGYSDLTRLLKNEKLEFISKLNEKNIFALKGVISLVAEKLSISEPTLYRYIQEIK